MTDNLKKSYKLPYNFAKNNGVIVSEDNLEHPITIYHVPHACWQSLAEIQRAIPCELHLEEVDETRFQKHLAHVYQSQSSILDAAEGMEEDMDVSLLASIIPLSEDLLANQDEAPIIRLLNALFTQAIKQKASDIHIETYQDKVLVRNRVDGILHEVLDINRAIAPLVISRVKVMAKLDIAEKRIPQDGRISLRIGGHNIDVRVSTLPSNHGERIVLRILDKEAAQLDLNLLGMSASTLKTIRVMLTHPHGIILVTGPTGSGKTTSLYAMLTELNQVTRNILTIEDPIEYELKGIGQTQVNTKVHLTFAKGLRAILRQDPDVVMIGEIRDLETAQIAIQASLTGHLVLSTLHTNSALSALTRLRDMGVESFLLSSSIVGLIAQRLVRTLCSQCKIPYELSHDELELMGFDCVDSDGDGDGSDVDGGCHSDRPQAYKPQGCDACNHLGYKGRTGIYELILIDETLRGMIHRNESIHQLESYLRPSTPNMRADGFKRVLVGDTSVAEVLRVT